MEKIKKNTLTVLQLYPIDMNIYGDNGNLLVLKNQIIKRGLEVNVVEHNVGDTLPKDVDIVIGGGGQDSGQEKIQADLLKNGKQIKTWAQEGTPMLMICGMYQLFGNYFKTLDGKVLEGLGILDIETHGTKERLIGNIITKSEKLGTIIGYENHSGQTYLSKNSKPLAKTIKGKGNNAKDGHEGALYKNVIGTYLHGPLLPKNPKITDFLIEKAAEKRGLKLKDANPSKYLEKARKVALSRPR